VHANTATVIQSLLHHWTLPDMDVLEIGSYNVNGSIRHLFKDARSYTGADIEPGPGVDRILPEPYNWRIRAAYDLVVSANTLEHVAWPWAWMVTAQYALRPGGWVCIVVPVTIGIHRYPVDCWRILPDGMSALLRWGGFDVVDVGQSKGGYRDVWGMGRKPLRHQPRGKD